MEVTAPGRARRYPTVGGISNRDVIEDRSDSSHFHDVRTAPAMAPLAAVSGTRLNLISLNVGGGRSPADAFDSVDRARLCRMY